MDKAEMKRRAERLQIPGQPAFENSPVALRNEDFDAMTEQLLEHGRTDLGLQAMHQFAGEVMGSDEVRNADVAENDKTMLKAMFEIVLGDAMATGQMNELMGTLVGEVRDIRSKHMIVKNTDATSEWIVDNQGSMEFDIKALESGLVEAKAAIDNPDTEAEVVESAKTFVEEGTDRLEQMKQFAAMQNAGGEMDIDSILANMGIKTDDDDGKCDDEPNKTVH